MRRVYKLFKWAVWTIESEDEDIEDEPQEPYSLESSHTLSAGDKPLFGFTTNFDWEEYE